MNAVRLTAYGGDAHDLPRAVLQNILDDVEEGRFAVPVHGVYELEEIRETHGTMERNEARGKMVVVVR
jgi:NADPH:quinone reductase